MILFLSGGSGTKTVPEALLIEEQEDGTIEGPAVMLTFYEFYGSSKRSSKRFDAHKEQRRNAKRKQRRATRDT